MRTTFTPAPDIADRLYDLAKKSKKSLNEVVNELIRKGLTSDNVIREPLRAYQVRSKNLGVVPGIDYERLTKVQEDMDIEDWIEKHGRP